MKPYEKSKRDADREKDEFKSNPVVRFMAHQDQFKFNVGDILIKQHRVDTGDDTEKWQTDLTQLKAPLKYLYAFENSIGIGYLKQLRVDGSGTTNATLICVTTLDPLHTRLLLDPEYADHLLLSAGEQFDYHKAHQEKKEFRRKAIETNRKLLIAHNDQARTIEWFHNLQVGDQFWMGHVWEDLIDSQYEVVIVTDNPISKMPSYLRSSILVPIGKYRTIEIKMLISRYPWGVGRTSTVTVDHLFGQKITIAQPLPLEDPLCGPAK